MRTNEEWACIFKKVREETTTSQAKHEVPITNAALAKFIDHTQLKLDAGAAQIDEICAEARDYDFAAVCVRANWVVRATANLANTNVFVACVIGFHEGTQSLVDKVKESEQAVKDGAKELDVVLNRDLLKAGEYTKVYEELSTLRKVAPNPIVCKLIFETSQLSREEIIAAGVLAGYAGFDFIKTSTGFCGRGASVEDVELMTGIAEYIYKVEDGKTGPKMRIKASGGVRSLQEAIRMIELGASRIGTSSGVKIMQEAKAGKVEGQTARNGGLPKQDDETY